MLTRVLAALLFIAGAASPRTVSYATRAGAQLDLELPAGTGPFLTVVAIHGGGWTAGNRALTAPFCRLVVQQGYACASPDYRLAPAARLPRQMADLREAILFLLTNAPRFRLDPRGVVLAGESAGGHLAAMLGATHPDELRILGVMAFSAPTDLIALGEPGRPLDTVAPEIRDLLGVNGWGREDTERIRTASPVFQIRRHAPPFLLIHGQDDRVVPVSQAIQFCQALRSAGSVCDAVIGRGLHGLWREDNFGRSPPFWQAAAVTFLSAAGTNSGYKTH